MAQNHLFAALVALGGIHCEPEPPSEDTGRTSSEQTDHGTCDTDAPTSGTTDPTATETGGSTSIDGDGSTSTGALASTGMASESSTGPGSTSSSTGGGGDLLGSIVWPFNDYSAADFPDPLVIRTFYNGFFNDPPCQNAQTTLTDVDVPWNTTVVHEYNALTDATFDGFALCIENGTDEHLGLQIENLSGWGIEESNSIDTGAPDLTGHVLERIELVVEEASVTGTPGNYDLHIEMRWDFYGTP